MTTTAPPEGAPLTALPSGPTPIDPHAHTQRIPKVRNGGIAHELYLAFTIHGSDPLELTEIGDAISAVVTRETAGRAVVRNKTQITSPVRTASIGGTP